MDNKVILVIEDEKALRENICDIIRHSRFAVISASTGEEALKLIDTTLPDIIICDIMLPGIDGHQVLANIKDRLASFSYGFIFLTAKSTRTDTRIGMDMGADDYLTKPFTQQELINSIHARIKKLSEANHSHALSNNALIRSQLDKVALLTNAEKKVMQQICEGLTTPQIAEKLVLSKKTIENHRVNISRKLNLTGPNSLINFASRLRPELLEIK